jgi:hypothetical protein
MFISVKGFYGKALLSALFILSSLYITNAKPIAGTVRDTGRQVGQKERAYCVALLSRIADPVLNALSTGALKEKMPVEARPGDLNDRKKYTYLEAFGRLMAGMAPWLELGPDATPEGQLRKKYINLSLACIKKAVNPASPDFMNFNKGGQPLVDAAFLAEALLRAPQQLWGNLNAQTKAQLIAALKSTRVITPGYNNWLMFSATIEAALLEFDGKCDYMRIDYALRQIMLWYKGDGVYGDGPHFHWDYYNSFVIQPMMLDVLQTLLKHGYHLKKEYETVLERAQRYAAIQERLISPVATYPLIGRSLAYRFGAFQVLSQLSLMKQLPASLPAGQVRYALYSVIKNQMSAPGTFDKNGWLQIGVYGHQPEIGEGYISTGSLYLCSVGMLMLGLPPDAPFWNAPDEDWTEKKAWAGNEIPIDHAINN